MRGIAIADATAPSIKLNPVRKSPEELETRYVFDVVVHRPDEMAQLLNRIQQLAETVRTEEEDPELALVLHGPEIAFFTSRNYPQYAELVDRAAELDKKGIIDVKVCDTMIRSLGLEQEKLPDFVDHVPYGPSEIERLVQQGYIRM